MQPLFNGSESDKYKHLLVPCSIGGPIDQHVQKVITYMHVYAGCPIAILHRRVPKNGPTKASPVTINHGVINGD